MKLQRLEAIMEKICEVENLQEGIDIILNENPARIYFTFEQDELKGNIKNSKAMTYETISEIAEKYGLIRDKSKPKINKGVIEFRFKLNKEYKR